MASTTQTPVSVCTCGEHLDAATGRPGTTPKEGDVSLCGYCGALWSFNKDLTLQPLDVNTLPPGPNRQQILRAQAIIRSRRPS